MSKGRNIQAGALLQKQNYIVSESIDVYDSTLVRFKCFDIEGDDVRRHLDKQLCSISCEHMVPTRNNLRYPSVAQSFVW